MGKNFQQREKVRKQLRKDMKEYEKRLAQKADLGILSLSEKEEYQRIRRNQYRNGLFKREEMGQNIMPVIALVTIFGVAFYLNQNTSKPQPQTGESLKTSDYSVSSYTAHNNSFSSFSEQMQRNQLVGEINQITDSFNKQIELMTEAINTYGSTRTLPEQYAIQM